MTKYLTKEKRQRSTEDVYNSAVARTLLNERESILRTIRAAVNTYGYRNFARLRLDVAFRSLLAKDPEFKKAIDKLEHEAKKLDQEAAEEAEASAKRSPESSSWLALSRRLLPPQRLPIRSPIQSV